MSKALITLGVIVGVFAMLVIIPRIIMAIKTAKLKGKPAPAVHKLSAKRIKSGSKTVLYFYTPPCGACKIQEPIIQNVMKKYPEAIFKIDASRDRASSSAYGVLGVPFLVYIEGGKVITAKAGVQTEQKLINFLSK